MWAAKLSQRNCPVDAAEMKAHQGKGVEPQRVNIPDEDFQVKGEPLYGGKGKRSGLIYNHCDFHPLDTHKHAGEQPSPSTITDTAFSEVSETTAHAGPNQPRLQSSNSVVLGKAKKTDAPRKQTTPTGFTGRTNHHIPMDTAAGTDGYRHTYGSHSLPPSSKLNVPKWASATTPSGRVAQRLGHIWVPHTYWQTMDEGRDVGGSCQGSAQLSPIARGNCTF